MYKKYNELINKTNRFLRSYTKEPITNAFLTKGFGQSVIDSGQTKVAEMSDYLGQREVIDAQHSDAIHERKEYLRGMKREVAAFERTLSKLFRTEAEKRKYGFVTRYTNEEQETDTTAINDQDPGQGSGTVVDVETDNAAQTETPPGTGSETTAEPTTVRVARRRSESAAAIMGDQRQVAVGISDMTQEAKDRLAEYGWPEERLTMLAGMGDVFENLCRIAEDKDTEVRITSVELESRYRALKDWYRTVSQTARDLAKDFDHLAPELKLMGQTLAA